MFRRPFARRFYRPLMPMRAYRPFLWRRRAFGWGFGGCAMLLMLFGCASLAMLVLVRRF